MPIERHRNSLPSGSIFHSAPPTLETGGGGRDRTDDLKLAKLALSQLSYAPGFMEAQPYGKWWAREDLNLRPHAYQACALTN